MTKTELQEWKAHPVTKEILEYIKSQQTQLALEPLVDPDLQKTFSVDDIAVRATFRDGFLSGLDGINDSVEYLEWKMEATNDVSTIS